MSALPRTRVPGLAKAFGQRPHKNSRWIVPANNPDGAGTKNAWHMHPPSTLAAAVTGASGSVRPQSFDAGARRLSAVVVGTILVAKHVLPAVRDVLGYFGSGRDKTVSMEITPGALCATKFVYPRFCKTSNPRHSPKTGPRPCSRGIHLPWCGWVHRGRANIVSDSRHDVAMRAAPLEPARCAGNGLCTYHTRPYTGDKREGYARVICQRRKPGSVATPGSRHTSSGGGPGSSSHSPRSPQTPRALAPRSA